MLRCIETGLFIDGHLLNLAEIILKLMSRGGSAMNNDPFYTLYT